METLQNPTRTVAYFSGDFSNIGKDNGAVGNLVKGIFEWHGAKVITAPDPYNVALGDIYSAVQKADRSLPLTVIIEAHGNNYDFGHGVKLDKVTPTEEVFIACRHAFRDKPIDFFINSCHSGGALKAARFLPKGSVVAASADEDKTGIATFIPIRALSPEYNKNLKRHSLSALDLLKAHFVANPLSFYDDVSGGYAISDGSFDVNRTKIFKVSENLKTIQSDGFKPGDFARAKAELADYMSPAVIKRIMAAMSNTRARTKPGKRLAVAMAVGPR